MPDLIDMLSEEGLSCVAPRLHRGWQDKRQSCRSARRATAKAVGFDLDEVAREDLLAGVALTNRLLLLPGPAILDLDRARSAVRSAKELADRLASRDPK